MDKTLFFYNFFTDLRIVIGDGALSFADSSGAVLVDPDLLCSRLLVKLGERGWISFKQKQKPHLDYPNTSKEVLNVRLIGSWRKALVKKVHIRSFSHIWWTKF